MWSQSRAADRGREFDKCSSFCILGLEGEKLTEGEFRTTQ
jgi:hypothetical protein